MTEYLFKGRLTLEGVEFSIHANSPEEALARAAQEDFDGYDTDRAHSVDWHLVAGSIEENV